MQIGKRDLSKVVNAMLKKEHYIAGVNMIKVYENPIGAFNRYLFSVGAYPANIAVRTPLGTVDLEIFSHDDILTVNEVFCRLDYKADRGDKIVVDFGSNIGVSGAYFLTRSDDVFVYLYEPLSKNLERLRSNLSKFEGKFELNAAAVGVRAEKVEFGWEESGRYGGVGIKTGSYIEVDCLSAKSELERILALHGYIDILKMDIESMELAIIDTLTVEMLMKIKKIYIEYRFSVNPLDETHSMRQYGGVAQFSNKNWRMGP